MSAIYFFLLTSSIVLPICGLIADALAAYLW